VVGSDRFWELCFFMIDFLILLILVPKFPSGLEWVEGAAAESTGTEAGAAIGVVVVVVVVTLFIAGWFSTAGAVAALVETVVVE